MRAPGTKIGRYEIEALLGSGGMGDVYRAHDSELHRHVALKMIRATDDEAITRFMREARSAARLSHAGAVTVFDVGRTDDGPYIAMELVEGKTLRETMEGRRAPLEERVKWLREVAEVLRAAHDAGIVHRDIKPENVMIRPDGTAKVLDFGVARAPSIEGKDKGERAPSDLSTLTTEGAIIGTISYMAPEQLRGDPIDGRADQFSWAVVAFELLAGKLPWPPVNTAVKLLSQILSLDAPSPRAAGASIPESLDRVIHRALSRHAEDRFAGMRELLSAMEQAEAEVVAQGAALPPTLPAVDARREKTESPVSRTERSAPAATKKAPRPRPLVIGLLAAGAALGIGAIIAQNAHGPDPVTIDASASAAKPAASSEAGADERSHCPNPEADRLYASALDLWRTESEQRGVAAMEHVTDVDPTCGGPRLRVALYYYAFDPARGRVLYAAARGGRASLSPRDALLLDAAAPYFDDPPDAKAWFLRARTIAASRPNDASVAFDEAYAAWRAADANAALEAAGRAITLAPDHVRARWLSGVVRAELLRDLDGAIAELDKCIEHIPAASSCYGERAALLAEQGKCEELERTARAWLARSPTAAGPRILLASALVSARQPKESVDEAWSAAVEHLPVTRKEEERARGTVRRALEYGDLKETERALESWITLAKKREDVSGRLGPAAELAALYAETDRPKEAARLAKEHLAREPGLQRDDNVWWMSTQDVPIAASLVLAMAGGEADQAKARRAAWLEHTNALEAAGRVPKGFGWITTDARFARTPDEARAALARPEAELVKTAELPAQLAAWVGGAKALAGQSRDALVLLRRANSACDAWLWPAGEHARAIYLRGLAAADAGEAEEAQAALAHVAERWPQTKLGRAAKTRLASLRTK